MDTLRKGFNEWINMDCSLSFMEVSLFYIGPSKLPVYLAKYRSAVDSYGNGEKLHKNTSEKIQRCEYNCLIQILKIIIEH